LTCARGEVLTPRGSEMESLERDALQQSVREQNSRLERLIEVITQLVARSRDVLRRQRPEDSAPAGKDHSP
jgi:hypothetical protein